jgi:hypothetical protein
MMTIEYPYGLYLPIFPTLYGAVTEDRLERCVERLMDRADAALMSGRATQQQYDSWCAALSRWADAQRTLPDVYWRVA